MKLTFVVPIYNVKPYLRKCVESLLRQDYQDYEMVLVDDGSTDGSGELADELAQSDPSIIRVIHQQNKGLSGARNTGVDAAGGEYICFVDSDDYWQPDVFSSLIAQIERDGLDILRFNFQNVNEQGQIALPNQTTDPHIFNDYSSVVTTGMDFIANRFGIGCYAVQFIVRSELCRQERFTEGILFEDTDWTPRILLRANRIASTDRMVYNYLTRVGSITKAVDLANMQNVLNNKMLLIRSLLTMRNGLINNYGKVAAMQWFDGMIAMMVLGIFEILATAFYCKRKEYINQLKALNLFPLSYYNIHPKAIKKIVLINISPKLALFILHIR